VSVRRFKPDWDDLIGDQREWLELLLQEGDRGAHYTNPQVVVSATEPTDAFWRLAYNEQGAWCAVVGRMGLRRAFRRVTSAYDAAQPGASRKARFAFRRLAYTGVVMVGGRILDPKRWAPRPTRRSTRSA
jgi:hypothetical protein